MVRVIFVFLVCIFVFGCVSEDIKELQGSEIRDYEGERLSSIGDFRENSIKGVQYIDIENYSLKVGGLVENEIELSYDDVLEFQKYKKVVELDCVEGWSANILWEGVLVRDLLDQAKVLPSGNTIIFYAYDGYSTSFPLDYVIDNDILLAYKMNDVVIPAERGFPFQLIAESKWGYKWIKWVTRIEVSDDEDYKGYWEKRGYSNTGDLDKGFFE